MPSSATTFSSVFFDRQADNHRTINSARFMNSWRGLRDESWEFSWAVAHSHAACGCT